MKRIKIILKLLFGKQIMIYDTATKELIGIFGKDGNILKNGYGFEYIGKEECLLDTNGIITYTAGDN